MASGIDTDGKTRSAIPYSEKRLSKKTHSKGSLMTKPFLTASILAFALVFVAADFAEARRLGSFGSRGSRTFQAPAATPTAPRTAPVERSMTPQSPAAATPAANRSPATAAAPRSMFGQGLGGSIMRGLLIGGLIGVLLGYGFGGLAGMLGLLAQLAIAMVIATLAVRWFANRQRGAPTSAPVRRDMAAAGAGAGFGGSGPGPYIKSPVHTPASAPVNAPLLPDAPVEQSDLDVFERMLADVQDAYAREDYAALRKMTTPEVMSYLSEELSQNATAGMRNDVSDTKLLQGDVSESWTEEGTQYATVAMRYQSRDVMRDRTSGAVISGDADALTEATELWTFVRPRAGDWKLSAIQET
jgi:predicted lipid-binding transport protein (Tim44 family)